MKCSKVAVVSTTAQVTEPARCIFGGPEHDAGALGGLQPDPSPVGE